ncbi:hypothetical protein Z959_12155 [Clostridium novyi B str. ATCC 27606]|uniref:Peptidase S1 domain-containing protein n=2 Tax=Clostridium TaxID=1485 RepID=A0AA40M5Q3_CLONO|nr:MULTISPECIES: hypothetical protein [Clostridium]KEI10840.1 hypothetical protein Z958_11370 [Clostridium novyi B str. NCTC 9691]KEI15699.1 hypothetical protein Z959_12155 [Clostridium novyi B str. ATCC 27606]KEI15742.1 hypothetical protein Z960_11820 [Clostridium haemolyticum NCTC 9693]KGN02628.1 hypothetical protein Z961_08155 [Clostridium haemolyticum NCTC 8350]CAG7840760.1 hypothetical protein CLOHAE12215_02184 [Clostridium haemolyticum]
MVLSKNNCDNEENKLQENIVHICNCDYKYFLNKKNVVGLGLGYKVKNGFYTNQLSVQVFVCKKFPKNELNNNDIIPLMYKGIPTDVKETGYFRACSLNEKKRPVIGGYNIGTNMNNEISGTAGYVVTNGVSKFILSTNHVIANINMSPIKTPIIQPSYICGGYTPTDTIATLHKFIPLRLIKGRDRPINLSDCALGLLVKSDIMSSEIAFIGKVNCVKSPKLGLHVRKVGSTTELTEGIITNTNGVMIVNYYNDEKALFKDQIFTNCVSERGDSGSILVDDNKCALGLLCSYNNIITSFNRLSTVLEQLDVYLSN